MKSRAAMASEATPRPLPSRAPSRSHRLDDLLDHLLGIGEQHHGVVAKEQLVVDPGIARGQRALDEEDRLGFYKQLKTNSAIKIVI